MAYSVDVKAGKELSTVELETCVSVIRAGCAVDPESAKEELPHAVHVCILRMGEEIVGVGAVKRLRPRYANRIASSDKSGFAFDPKMHELGYVAVLENHRGRGLSSRIVEGLLSHWKDQLWATTSSANMKTLIEHRGFVRQGREWPGEKEKPLSLWIRSK